jgi:hypothetical protein
VMMAGRGTSMKDILTHRNPILGEWSVIRTLGTADSVSLGRSHGLSASSRSLPMRPFGPTTKGSERAFQFLSASVG